MRKRIFSCHRIIVALLAAWFLPMRAGADDGLIGHWLFDPTHVLGQGLPDLAGRNLTIIEGPVQIERMGDWPALRLDERVAIHLNRNKDMRVPTRAITAEAWVRIDLPQPWGGIIGSLRDNGLDEKGWLLGFQDKKFMFTLKGNEGPPTLTYLTAPQAFERRAWYHVAGTYDGEEQKLFVNGKQVATSRQQQGGILYPPKAYYQIGAYRDEDEFYRTMGWIHEVRVYERALSADEIEKQYRAKQNLVPEPSLLCLASVFTSNMVLQRNRHLPVWGWAKPGEKISVKLGKDQAVAIADPRGDWDVLLPPQKTGAPTQLVVTGQSDQLTLENVLIGEVWLCSGQSNMQWPVQATAYAQRDIPAADFPNIRFFTVKNVMEAEPSLECYGTWEVCRPQTVAGFSAVAYYFGRNLHDELKVPIGLINSSWGGSLCEAWMSREALEGDPDFAEILKQSESNPWLGRGLYNGMIHPLIPFAIRGATWYQGESNSPRADQYRRLFPALIRDWRGKWGDGDFPFYYVQLCPFKTDPVPWAELWDAQRHALSVANTGMVVTTDIGELRNIHPRNKQEVGRRLALWALSETYGRKGTFFSGPLYKSMQGEGNRIRINFDHATGLASRDGQPLNWFTIAGADRAFESAQATIDGETVVVSSHKVLRPVAVRFAWSGVAQPNLINTSGLPASPFRTDNWPLMTAAKDK